MMKMYTMQYRATAIVRMVLNTPLVPGMNTKISAIPVTITACNSISGTGISCRLVF